MRIILGVLLGLVCATIIPTALPKPRPPEQALKEPKYQQGFMQLKDGEPYKWPVKTITWAGPANLTPYFKQLAKYTKHEFVKQPHGNITINYRKHLPKGAVGITYPQISTHQPHILKATVLLQPDASPGVVLHELAHAVGLGHSTNPKALMFWQVNDATGFTPQEIRALRRLQPN